MHRLLSTFPRCKQLTHQVEPITVLYMHSNIQFLTRCSEASECSVAIPISPWVYSSWRNFDIELLIGARNPHTNSIVSHRMRFEAARARLSCCCEFPRKLVAGVPKWPLQVQQDFLITFRFRRYNIHEASSSKQCTSGRPLNFVWKWLCAALLKLNFCST